MNTFLPYSDFQKSAACLDNKRLGKQRVEVLQILKALFYGPERKICYICDNIYSFKLNKCPICRATSFKNKELKTPWYNHPAVQMWKGYERSLAYYGICCVDEWKKRGFKDSCYDKIVEISQNFPLEIANHPKWLGNDQFHASHRSNLLRKNSFYYSQFGWTEPNNLGYYWPTKEIK